MRKHLTVLLALHVLLLVYSAGDILSKLASGQAWLSPAFVGFYGLMMASLVVYAVGWQQVIARMPLTEAYANRAVTVIWGMVWGTLIFHEQLTPGKLLGGALVLAGVVLYALSEDGEGDA